jgi:sugar phosphate isomerase/epimerase
MKLSVSNIAWDSANMDEYLSLLVEHRCQGLEFSPSMVWEEPSLAPASDVDAFRRKVESFGLKFSSMHSLTYTRPDLVFFESQQTREKLIGYILGLGQLANGLGVPLMVFGSARSRNIGNRKREECNGILAETFRAMAEGLAPLEVTLLIEPLGRQYTDCINTCREAMELVNMVDHRNFALHVDLKSSFEEGEDLSHVWSGYKPFIRHCHVANPGMAPPGPDFPGHALAAQAIRESGYDGYISLEVTRVSDPEVLADAIDFVREVYL